MAGKTSLSKPTNSDQFDQKLERASQDGNSETAKSTPDSHYFDQAWQQRGEKAASYPNDHKENSDATVKAVPPPVNAASLATGSTNETTKPKESNPSRDNGNDRRTVTDTTSVPTGGAAPRSPAKPHHAKYVDQVNHSENQKRPSRSHGSSHESKRAERARNPQSDKRLLASEGTPGRARSNPSDRFYGTPLHNDVVVPPFAEWDENNPASGEKYTGIFKLIADNRNTPGTPYQPPETSDQKLSSTADKVSGTFILDLMVQQGKLNNEILQAIIFVK